MECLAILNRLSIFSCDDSERTELCSALELEAETLVPGDVPLAALDLAVTLLSDHSTDAAIVRCVCTFLSNCALGDSQVVRKYLYNRPKTGRYQECPLPQLVAVINDCLKGCVINYEDTLLGSWRSSVQPLTDLIATLSYNNGLFRAAFGDSLVLLGEILARSRRDEQRHAALRTPHVRTADTKVNGDDPMSNPSASLYFYTISCVAVLLMGDARNSELALSTGVMAEILYCFKCLNTLAPPNMASHTLRREHHELGPVIKFSFAVGTAKQEINKWCLQALRNAAIAAPSHPAWGASSEVATLDFGRMGDIIAVDELKWELSQLRRKYGPK